MSPSAVAAVVSCDCDFDLDSPLGRAVKLGAGAGGSAVLGLGLSGFGSSSGGGRLGLSGGGSGLRLVEDDLDRGPGGDRLGVGVAAAAAADVAAFLGVVLVSLAKHRADQTAVVEPGRALERVLRVQVDLALALLDGNETQQVTRNELGSAEGDGDEPQVPLLLGTKKNKKRGMCERVRNIFLELEFNF